LIEVDNKISLDGHTDRQPYGSGARGYSNWELSADRANATRRELIGGRHARRKAGPRGRHGLQLACWTRTTRAARATGASASW